MKKIFSKLLMFFAKVYEQLKSFFFYLVRNFKYSFVKQYNVVKPRYLGSRWCDRSDLMIHVMFEVLSDFVEKEMPTNLDYETREEILDIYNWWHHDYNESVPESKKLILKKIEVLSDQIYGYFLHFNTNGDEIASPFDEDYAYSEIVDYPEDSYHAMFIEHYEKQLEEIEKIAEEQLNKYLKKLLKVRKHLWS